MKKIIAIVAILGLVGCSGQHCVTVGGTYDGVTGDVSYCYSADKTAEAGVPVLESEKGEAYLFDFGQVNEIADLLQGMQLKKIEKDSVSPKPIRVILDTLQQHREDR